MKRVIFFSALLALGIVAINTNKASALIDKRLPTNMCYRRVAKIAEGTFADGRTYRSYEFQVVGDQNMRARVYQQYGFENPAFYIRSDAAGCSDWFGASLFWDASGNVLMNGQGFARNFATGDLTKPEDVYFGFPAAAEPSLPNFNDFNCTAVKKGNANNSRILKAHVSCAGERPANAPFYGTINDAGGAYVNNNKLWCVGLSGYLASFDTTGTITSKGCHETVTDVANGTVDNVFNPAIYGSSFTGYGGAWAGFLDDYDAGAAGLPGLATPLRTKSSAVGSFGITKTTGGTSPGVNNFKLVVHGGNTRDAKAQNDGYGEYKTGGYYCYYNGVDTDCSAAVGDDPGSYAGQVITVVYPASTKCPDGSDPPGGNLANCPGAIEACPNFPNSTVSYAEIGAAPSGANVTITGVSYAGGVFVDGVKVADVGASTGTVPLANMAPYTDADIHTVSTDGRVTYTYIVYNPGNPTAKPPVLPSISGPYTTSNSFSASPNPWPSANIGCHDRRFDLSTNTFPGGTLNPDQEEPSTYNTPGSITAILTADDDVKANVLKVLSTPTITVTGARPGSSSVSNFTFGTSTTRTFNRTYSFDSLNGLNDIPGLASSWPLRLPLAAGDSYCSQLTLTKVKGEMDVFGVPITGKIDIDTENLDGGCQKVVDRPYVKVYNGDVRASTIKTWARYPGWTGAAGVGYRGSSSQFAAFIMSGGLANGLANPASSDAVTRGFYTASQRNQSGTPPCASVGLVFSNPGGAGCPSPNQTSSDVMAGLMPSIDKWWNLTIPASGSTITVSPTASKNINTPGLMGSDTVYYAHGQAGGSCPLSPNNNLRPAIAGKTGQCFILAGATVPDSRRVTVYVNGDLKIDSNICYGSCAGDRNYSDVDVMPYFTVVVKGSIFIDNDVTQLDGLYIALDNTSLGSDSAYSPGTIYTCTSDFKAPLETGFAAAAVRSGCGQPLRVNGALVGYRGVEFWRIRNSLRNSRVADASTIISGTNAAAEEINFIPEMLLSEPNFVEQSQKYEIDAFSGLPPVF